MLPVVGAIAVWFSWHLLLDLRSLKPWKMIFYDLLGPFSQGYVWYWGHSPNIKFITNILGGLDQKLGKWSKNDISPCPALKKVANKFREVSYISNHFQSCPRINRSSSLACFFTVSYLLHTAPHPNKHITPFCCPLKYGESVNLIKNLHPETKRTCDVALAFSFAPNIGVELQPWRKKQLQQKWKFRHVPTCSHDM